MAETSLTSLTAAEAVGRSPRDPHPSEALVARLPRPHRRPGAADPGLGRFDREAALDEAKLVDGRRREGKGVGPLHGVPVGIKDIIDTADLPTENGCAHLQAAAGRSGRGVRDGAAPAGAVILGKTVTTEFANHHPARRATRATARTRPAAPRPARPRRWRISWCRRGRHPDRRLGDPPGGLLWRLRVQADFRRVPRTGGLKMVSVARHHRRLRPLGGGRGAARRPAGRSTMRAMLPAPASRPRLLATATRTSRCRRCSRSSRRALGASPIRLPTRRSGNWSRVSARPGRDRPRLGHRERPRRREDRAGRGDGRELWGAPGPCAGTVAQEPRRQRIEQGRRCAARHTSAHSTTASRSTPRARGSSPTTARS